MKTEKESMGRKTKRVALLAFKRSIPVMGTYLTLGIGFGMLLEKNGYGVWWALGMSVLIYAGAMQYVAVGLLTSGASVLTAAFTTFTVNIRHFFYGLSMLERYRDTGKAKPYLFFSLTDETYSLVCTEDTLQGADRKRYYVILSLLNQCYWICGGVAGSLLSGAGAFDSAGIEFSMTALFVTVFLEQWLSSDEHVPALMGMGISVLCLFLCGAEYFLIPTMLLTTVGLTLYRRQKRKGETL